MSTGINSFVSWLKAQYLPTLIVLAFLLGTYSATSGQAGDALPGVIRQDKNVFLFENHSTAYLIWHSLGIRNATLVHLDTHDDCRYVPPEKIEKLKNLTKKKDWQTLFNQSDIGLSIEYKIRNEDLIYDLGNFIYPCLLDGTVSTFYWVIPDKTLDDATAARLTLHLQSALQIKDMPPQEKVTGKSFSFMFNKARIIVTTLDGLPEIPEGALLDIDIDFFAFPSAMSENHLTQRLLWSPPEIYELLAGRVPRPAALTISSSVLGGYLPVILRFLADACFDNFTTGAYPSYAAQLLDVVNTMRTQFILPDIPAPPDGTVYLAACRHLRGLAAILKGQDEEGLSLLTEAARLQPIYAKGLLDMSEVFLTMQKTDLAGDAIRRFEKIAEGPTFHSDAAQTRLSLALQRLDQADALSQKLVQWDDSSFSMLLRGGVLTEQGKYKEAARTYAEIIRQRPHDSIAYFNMGVVLEKQKHHEEAADYFRSAIRLRPDFAQAHEDLGHVHLLAGKLKEAEASLRSALQLNPMNVATLNNLGLTLSRQSRFEEAVAVYQRAIGINPNVSEIHMNMARALASLHRKDEAALHYNESIRRKDR